MLNHVEYCWGRNLDSGGRSRGWRDTQAQTVPRCSFVRWWFGASTFLNIYIYICYIYIWYTYGSWSALFNFFPWQTATAAQLLPRTYRVCCWWPHGFARREDWWVVTWNCSVRTGSSLKIWRKPILWIFVAPFFDHSSVICHDCEGRRIQYLCDEGLLRSTATIPGVISVDISDHPQLEVCILIFQHTLTTRRCPETSGSLVLEIHGDRGCKQRSYCDWAWDSAREVRRAKSRPSRYSCGSRERCIRCVRSFKL